jgi:dihydrofolate reductase
MMSATVLYMSMSLDGFVAGPNETPDNGLGDGGDRLHEWIFAGSPTEHAGVPGRPPGVNGAMMDELMATGAVLAGRGTVEPAGHWGGDHHSGVPIFILSRRPEAEAAQWPLVTYMSDVEAAASAAKEAAGEKDVLVHGVGTAQLALAAGVLDELQIHLVPVLLGEGRRLFEHLGAGHIELEQTRIVEGEGVTHLRYRVGDRHRAVSRQAEMHSR